ncbi:hypothetical protein TPHA_0L00620 [Tetrapisispora phaffii CBS 4417]|uniref:Mitochondrial distribution and morphology protein 10 n=1 Tax=Tetrapisispora phaffii (strain ATCC 24235 / CBS 4417 / NBRC 1672 / NRRL Y-8282 / UCD 70-5) TaxID=1071381 RepID=G8BZU0_TETPH|nr:hypothetical protein TPHA_0L00620 [Tetrapisispora phaffii CBS 4417]CCE65418.1 hypothetical protein TPHA_0L00620 [Tetrapisispora phaffii CBS 4417]
MLEYMDYIVKAFEISTNWPATASRNGAFSHMNGSGYNSVEFEDNMTATSDNLLNFYIPNVFKFQLSNKSSPFTFNTIDITTKQSINGSFAYIYTNAENLDNIVKNTSNVNLLDIVDTYQVNNKKTRGKYSSKYQGKIKSLYYGRMYYPSSFLEAMVIKKFNPSTQVIVKWISSSNNCNIVTGYLQRSNNRTFQEFVLSSNDFLCGYKLLHHFVESPSKFNNSLYNNSQLSVGAEAWLSVSNLSPTCSSTLRYCTHSASTGRPLMLTCSLNPIFGHLSSTYSAKTTSNSTCCVKYDFNLYSMESNLSLGTEIWKNNSEFTSNKIKVQNTHIERNTSDISNKIPNSDKFTISEEYHSISNDKQKKVLNDLNATFTSSLQKIDKERSLIENFQNNMYDKNFTSVWKFSTSLREKNLRILWNGKYKDFILVAGTELLQQENKDETTSDFNKNGFPYKFVTARLGFQIQYSS